MWSTDGEMQVCAVKHIKSHFLAGRSTEKCLTQIFPRDLSQRVPGFLVSRFCFSRSPQLAPCAPSLGHSMDMGQQEADAFPAIPWSCL